MYQVTLEAGSSVEKAYGHGLNSFKGCYLLEEMKGPQTEASVMFSCSGTGSPTSSH